MKAWLQLVRLPNVFTAIADVMMGFLVTHGSLQPVAHFTLLAAASCLIYLSGMVLNDVFDADVDAVERPERPIPSGRIAKRAAGACGVALLTSGTLAAWFASYVTHDWRPSAIGTVLAACVVLYDLILKRTPFAPLAMGACRTFNVLLGMSLGVGLGIGIPPDNEFIYWGSGAAWLIALGIGLYIVGVTWFARTEARASSRWQLLGGTAVLLAGMGILASVPNWNANDLTPPLRVNTNSWFLLWTALALIIGRRCALAIYDPTPARVQTAVRLCVQSIIVLDAALCVGFVSAAWGFAILSLLLPTVLLAAWLKAT